MPQDCKINLWYGILISSMNCYKNASGCDYHPFKPILVGLKRFSFHLHHLFAHVREQQFSDHVGKGALSLQTSYVLLISGGSTI